MTSKPRFAFFGTPELAAVFLDDLEKAGLVPSLIVTTPDRPRGRGLALTPPPVKVWGEARSIPVLQPEKPIEAAEALQKDAYDFFLVIYYGKILPRAVFDIPKRGTINVHFSLLPRWKGTSPIRACILNDDKKAGVSLVLMDEKIDHGQIVAQKELRIAAWPPSASGLEEQATHESAALLTQIIGPWLAGEIEAREQNHDLETLCPAYAKEDGRLDLAAGGYANLLKIRGFDSTVGTHAYFERGGKTLRVQILSGHLEGSRLVIDSVKPEGKKEMPYEEFLRSGAKPL
jgi:methionyl-tRNA formyltransferase